VLEVKKTLKFFRVFYLYIENFKDEIMGDLLKMIIWIVFFVLGIMSMIQLLPFVLYVVGVIIICVVIYQLFNSKL
jgi:hypothetical protein